MKFKLIQPNLFDSENNTISKYHIYHTRISGRYAPFILALAEGSVVRTQGLASLAKHTLSFSFIYHVFSCMADILVIWLH